MTPEEIRIEEKIRERIKNMKVHTIVENSSLYKRIPENLRGLLRSVVKEAYESGYLDGCTNQYCDHME